MPRSSATCDAMASLCPLLLTTDRRARFYP
jgi:hypothetical protein